MLVNKPYMYSIVDTHTRHCIDLTPLTTYISFSHFVHKRGADWLHVVCSSQLTPAGKTRRQQHFLHQLPVLNKGLFGVDMVLEGSQCATPIAATRLAGLECRSILPGVRIYMVKLLRRNHQHLPRQKKNTTSLTHRHLHVFEILPSYPYPGPPASKEWQPPWWLPSRSSYLLDESCTHQPARRKGEELLDRPKCRGIGQVRILQKLQCYKAFYRRFKLICLVIEQLNAMHLDP